MERDLLPVGCWTSVWEANELSNEHGHGLSSVSLFQVLGLFDRLSVGVKKCREGEGVEQLSVVIVDGYQSRY